MKLYSVRPEYPHGPDRAEKLEAQSALLQKLGLKLAELTRTVVCDADTVLALVSAGFCGRYYVYSDHVELIHEVPPEPHADFIAAAVDASFAAASKIFNDKVECAQSNSHLFGVSETKLLEDGCTDLLQEQLSNGWRILAVCPQPQRRPDYVLGRAYLPKVGARG